MKIIYQLLMVLSFIKKKIIQKNNYAMSERACWHPIFSITSSSISDFILFLWKGSQV